MEKLLIVVDFQNDFVVGPLGFEKAPSLEPAIVHLIESFEKGGDEVVFTKDLHYEDYLHTEEGRNLPVPHCIKGTAGAEFFGSVKTLSEGHKVFEKNTFGSSALFEYLCGRRYRTIALCGVDGSICVFANAVVAKSADPEAHIEVLADATGSGDEEALGRAYAAMRRLHIEVIMGPSKVGGIF